MQAEADMPACLQGSTTELKRAGEQLRVLRKLGALTQPLLRHISCSLAVEEAALTAILGTSAGALHYSSILVVTHGPEVSAL